MGKKGKAAAFIDLPDEEEEAAAPAPAAADPGAGSAPAKQGGKKAKKGKDKKGKQAFDSDEDEGTTMVLPQADDGDVPAPMPSKPKAKGKKGKASKPGFAALDDDDELPVIQADEEEEEVVSPPPAKKGTNKKGKAGGKGAAGFAALGLGDEDEGEEPSADADAQDDDEDEEPQLTQLTIVEVTSAKPHPKAADKLRVCEVSTGKQTFQVVTNALNVKRGMKVVYAPVGVTTASGIKIEPRTLKGVDSNGMLCSAADIGWTKKADGQLVVLPDELELGAPAPATRPKGDDDDAVEEEEQDASPEAADDNDDKLAVSKASSKKPKKKGKGKDTASLFAALEAEENGTAEHEPVAEEEAAPADNKKKKKAGSNAASLFAALEADGEAAPEPAAEEQEEEVSPAPKDKKKKKKGADAASLFAALEAEDGVAEGANGTAEAEEAPVKKDKKKKKGGADVDSLFAALAEGDQAPDAAVDGEAEEIAAPKKDKKKKKGGKEVDSLFEALAEGQEEQAAAPEPAIAPAPEPSTSSGKGGKGKAAAKAATDPELDALLAELEAPKTAAPTAGGKKKKKGKGGKDVDKEEEDIDALLAALDGPKAAPAAAAAAAAPAPSEPAPSAEPAAKDAAKEDEEEGEGGEDVEAMAAAGKELTAAQKKKLKKKQKEKEKKAAAAKGEAEGDEAAAAPAKAGGKPVKESAMARKIREELERRQKAEEAARAAEEARRLAEEEEERRAKEEEERKAEERRLKKEREKAKKEQLKKEGKLLTGKAKAEAERLAAMRAQLLKQAEEKGIVLEPSASDAAAAAAAADAAAAEAEADAKKPKKVVYQTKKQQQKKKEEEAAKAKEEEEARVRAEEEARQAAEAAAAAAAAAAVEQDEDAADDWEAAADDWEAIDVDTVKAPATAAAEPAPAATEKAAPAAKAAPAKAESKPAEVAKPPAAPAHQEKSEEGEEEEEEEEEESASQASEEEASESGSEDEEESGSESGSESDSEEDSDSESESEEESDSEEDDSSDYSMDSKERRVMRLEEAREKRLARAALARKNASKEELRSPICCILGHVDVGKTKILDNIRRTNVQEGEAGGITQQIGATFVPNTAIEKRTESLRAGRAFDMRLPGLLVIDTPGHESFTNLRARGSGLCDIAVLIVDLMHGLEQQTIESINLLKMRKTPFIIALNKIDRLYGWKSAPDCPVRESFKRQKDFVMKEFEQRSEQVFLQLNEQGLNVSLYWKNPDPRKYVNIVPTSAVTGEGIPDLIQLMVKLTQTMMSDRLMFVDNTECTVLEVKNMEGLGTTCDCVLVNGKLKEGDRIVVCGLGGAIVTRIKALKTPQVLREMRVKGAMMDHKEIRAAMGVRIVAPFLETAVAGTSMYVIQPDDDEEELKDAVMADMTDIFSKVDKGGEGVCVQASTLGSLEALLTFLNSPEVNIPVSGINIGPVHRKDVLRANVMNEKGAKKYAVILAFDVPVAKEARELSEEFGVKIFTADIIYHLFDQFTAYVKEFKQQEQEAARFVAVFPCTLKILPTCIFNKKDPIVLGVEVAEGIAKVGTPICVPTKEGIDLGRIASMELNHKSVDVARAGQSVAMKIESTNTTEQSRLYGRHFDHTDALVSRITRESIDALKQYFQDEMTKDDWRLVIKLKKTFQIN